MTVGVARGARGLAHGFLLAGLVLGCLGVFASLGALEIGVWGYAEPVIAASLAAAVLAAIGLSIAPPRAGAFLHPVCLFALALAAWSALAAPLVTFPRLSLLGYHQSGQGVTWYLALACFLAAALTLRGEGRAFRHCLLAALIAAAGMVALMALDDLAATRFLPGIDSLYAYLAPPVMVCGWFGAAASSDRLRKRLWRGAALASTVALLALSGNRTAMAASLVGAVLYLAAPMVLRYRPLVAAVLAGAALAPLLIVAWLAPGLGVASLLSRHYLSAIAWETLATEPMAWIAGLGWGVTPHILSSNLLAAPVSLTDPGQWDLFHRDYFHFHNWILESLVSAGLPGLLLAAGLAVAPLIGASKRFRPAALAYTATLLLLDGLWMQMAYFLPFHALAVACLAREGAPVGKPAEARPAARRGRSARGTAATCGIALAAGLLVQGWFTLAHEPWRTAMRDGRDPDGTAATAMAFDDPRGDDLAFSLAARAAIDHLDAAWGEAGTAPRIDGLAAALAQIVPRTRSPLPVMACLGLHERLAKITDPASPLLASFSGRQALWRGCVDALLRLAPKRTDRLIFWFDRLTVEGRVGEIERLGERLLARDAEDPVALYFMGVARTFDSDPRRKIDGLLLIGRAIDNGLSRFMPVDPALRAMVDQAGNSRR